MLEQQLINAFMKFTARAGAGEFVRDLIRTVDENGNPKVWTAMEIEQAIRFLNEQTERFGRPEAMSVVVTLLRKFDISVTELPLREPETQSASDELPGVQGLQ